MINALPPVIESRATHFKFELFKFFEIKLNIYNFDECKSQEISTILMQKLLNDEKKA